MVLRNKSPFEVLFGHLPNYHSLKVFGCVCYPYLRPYNPHKLHFRTSHYLFLSYSSCHKGYKCLHPSGRLYISTSVTFDETHFPYLELFHPPTPTSLSSTNIAPSVHFPSPSLFSFPSQTIFALVSPSYPLTTVQNPNPSNSSNLFVPSANTPPLITVPFQSPLPSPASSLISSPSKSFLVPSSIQPPTTAPA